ncbi:CYFA0S19e02014g1_1 [Cyberlindnera fabianii]|uniref:CYFA0S19e02014g1_1 n=1 Tax=Cyberlindnera fabianii TaxID=36022 RepID=A0A061B8K7_CYBFA|nr:CYFA0S19e02014g1_1 [Cyberlindnera fabianii]
MFSSLCFIYMSSILTIYSVPAFQKIIGECGPLLQEYQQCLQKNIKDQTKCSTLLKQIRECASGCVNLNDDPVNKLSTR